MEYTENDDRLKSILIFSLLDSLQEQPYLSITDYDLAKRSGVSLSTFHRLFSNKDLVLEGYLLPYLDAYCLKIPKLHTQSTYCYVLTAFEILQDFSDTFLALANNDLIGLISYQCARYLASIPPIFPNVKQFQSYEQTLTAYQFLISGVLSVAFRWLKEGKNTPIEALSKFVSAMIEGKFITGEIQFKEL